MEKIEIIYINGKVEVLFPCSSIGNTYHIFIINKYSQESRFNHIIRITNDNLHITLLINIKYDFAKSIYPLEVQIYDSNYNLIKEYAYDDYLLNDTNLSNDGNSAYILYCNEKYANVVPYLIESLIKVSNKTIILYEVNCYVNINNKQVVKKHIHVPNVGLDMFYIKPFIMLEAFKSFKFDYLCFIDSDAIVNNNINGIWDYCKYGLEYPLFSKGIYEYTTMSGHACPHSDFDKKYNLSFNDKHIPYITTNLFLCSKDSMKFIKEWFYMGKDDDNRRIIDKYDQTSDETLANVMLYRVGAKMILPLYLINCWKYSDFDWVINKFNHTISTKISESSYYPKHGTEMSEGYSRIHINKKLAAGYHLIKTDEYAKKVLEDLNKGY